MSYFSIMSFRRTRSASPLRNKNKWKQSMSRRKQRSVRKTRSIGDLSREVPDDYTRELNARFRLHKGTASAVDLIQRLPRELQSKIFKEGRMSNPINSKNSELPIAARAKVSAVKMKKLMKGVKVLKEMVYKRAREVYTMSANYRTKYFFCGDPFTYGFHNKIYLRPNKNIIFQNLENFKRNTKVEFFMTKNYEYLLFRIVPKGVQPYENYYDGFIKNQISKEDRFPDVLEIMKGPIFMENKGHTELRTFRFGGYAYYMVHLDANLENNKARSENIGPDLRLCDEDILETNWGDAESVYEDTDTDSDDE